MSTRLPGAKYRRVFDGGRVFRARLFAAYVLKSGDSRRQAGVVVSKKNFHDAVDRNRAKRIMREGFRLMAPGLPPDADWVFVGRRELQGKGTADVMAEIGKIARRCGFC